MDSTLTTHTPANEGYSATTQIPYLPSTIVVSSIKRKLAATRFRMQDISLLMKHVSKADSLPKLIKKARALRLLFYGTKSIRKVAQVDGRYYWTHHCPGWPSMAYKDFMHNEINRLVTHPQVAIRPYIAFFAITKKCPLGCEHCFEWDNLNKREKLSLSAIMQIVHTLQDKGITQVLFSGGEPMLRVHDIVEVLKMARPITDFWVFTSGYNFTAQNARLLKEAGLTGVSVSLDHYLEQDHNTFRNLANAYQLAISAVVEAHKVGLVVSLALCATKAFVSEENLMQYARLAKRLGVAFIQILEPRAVGHYIGKEVKLNADQIQLLTNFYEKLNLQAAYADWPIVVFHGYHQRRAGCTGAGDRFLYIDTDGDLHACPFCQKKSGSLLTNSYEEGVSCIKAIGCHVFDSAAPK